MVKWKGVPMHTVKPCYIGLNSVAENFKELLRNIFSFT
jgi:hypothetical protein